MHGGKVIMPPSALEKLTRLHISYPMLFSLHNGRQGTLTHGGVLEFIAEEGRIYVPPWMMNVLLLEPGDLLQVKSCDLPLGNFIKLQPQSPEFLEISDPKAVLENVLRNFSALTKDDVFSFKYNNRIYEIAVLEVKPSTNPGKAAISCVEVDLEVDFAPPVGYVEPERTPAVPQKKVVGGAGGMAKQIGFDAEQAAERHSEDTPISRFKGAEGRKLGAKKSKTDSSGTLTPNPSTIASKRLPGSLQPLRLPHGKLFFGYKIVPLKKGDDDASNPDEGFSGEGRKLKNKSKK